MIADLKPYEKYKESGSKWLGRVPAHWEEFRLDRLFDLRCESPLPEDGRVTSYLNGRVTLRSNVKGQKIKGVVKDGGWIRVYPGDFAISGMNAHLGGMGVSDSLGRCSPIYLILRPKPGTNAHFVSHYMRYVAQVGALKSYVNTIRYNSADFKRDALKLFNITMPNASEQAAIVRFLNWANGRLDRAIRAKQKIIKLLEEQRQVIVHQAVTRGLNPDVKTKPSGVEWLGDVPEHWTLRRFKVVAQINGGHVDPKDYRYANQLLIAPNHIESATGRLIYQETARQQGADSGKYYVKYGQIIYSKIRPNLCKAVIAPSDCLCSADMYAISPKESELLTPFLLQLLLSKPFTKFAVDCSMRVAMPKINREALGDCLLWYPSLNEQQQIVDYLIKINSPYEAETSKIKREIDLLREYRTRLVSDVVTGKIDVREAAAKLPEESEGADMAPDGEDEEASADEAGQEDEGCEESA